MACKATLHLRILTSLFFPLLLSAQSLRFEHLSVEGGLSQRKVNSLLQDQKGFIWIATDNGLNRFDGRSFVHYKNVQGDATSLTNNAVKELVEDQAGCIWAATLNGLSRFDPKTETFRQYRHDPANPTSIAFNQIHAVFADEAGYIWAGASTSLEKLNPETGAFQHYPVPHETEVMDNGIFITNIAAHEGRLYIGTWGGDLQRFDQTDGSFSKVLTDDEKRNGQHWVEDLWLDANSTLWATFNGFAWEFDPTQDHFLRRFGNLNGEWFLDPITGYRAPSGLFYVGTSGDGLHIYRPDFTLSGSYLLDPDSTAQYHNFITDMLVSHEGEIWLGTSNNGLYKFDPGRQNFGVFPPSGQTAEEAHLDGTGITLELADGEIWTTSRSHGIQVFDRQKQRFTHLRTRPDIPDELKAEQIYCLFQDSQGRIWVGTWGKGLKVFDPKSGQYRQYRAQLPVQKVGPINDDYVTSICESQDQKLWVTTTRGVSVIGMDELDSSIFRNYLPDEDSLTNNLNSSTIAYCDHAGKIWVGTSKGLNLFDPKTDRFQHFFNDPLDPSTLSGSRVTFIFEDQKNRLWIGTVGGGLNLYRAESQSFTHFGEEDGLPNNTVQGMVEDSQGLLWLTTELGLAQFDPEAKTFINYFQSDGLPTDQFSARTIGLSRFTGEIFAGGMDGFLLFHPDSVRTNHYPPPVVISSLEKYVVEDGQRRTERVKGISWLDRIELPFSENTLTLEFAALSFRHAAKNQYAYQLEGLDDNWTPLGTRHELTLSHLSPGSYTLRVRASNNDSVWNKEGTALQIVIRPPWYLTWWAKLLYALAAGGLVFLFWRKEMQAQRLRLSVELEKMEAEKVKEFDQLKSRFYTNITHEFRTPLTVISGMAEHIEQPEKSRELIQRNSQSLLGLVNQMLDLAKLESGNLKLNQMQTDVVPFLHYLTESFHSFAAGKNIQLHFEPSMGQLLMDFDEEKLQSILSNLLSNAINFSSPDGAIHVLAKVEHLGEGQFLALTVKDQGLGIAPEKLRFIFNRFYQAQENNATGGTGIGLTLTKELVEMMGGQISVQSTPGAGSAFRVLLPITNTIPLTNTPKPYASPAGANLSGKRVLAVSPSGNTEESDLPQLLVIEDNADVVTYIETCLQGHYQIQVAKNGALGIEQALETIPDLILSDVMMPEKDGFEVCQTLKTDERTSHIPIVLLTAKADAASRLEGLKRGADAYLAKPFDKKELMVRMENLMALRAKLREKYAGAAAFPPAVTVVEERTLEPEDAFLFKVKKVLEDNLEKSGFGVAQLCQATGMSQPQLYRKIKALTGKSIVSYLRSYRLHAAKSLLESTDKPISEIAYQAGFSDPAYFSRAFSEEFDISPTEIRK